MELLLELRTAVCPEQGLMSSDWPHLTEALTGLDDRMIREVTPPAEF